jgi:hypothetical protein
VSSGGRSDRSLVGHSPESRAASGALAASLIDGHTSGDNSLAGRLRKACDENSQAPAHNHGRQAWVRTQLAERCGVAVSSETISKWFTGVARPRPERISALARVLDVDEAWLTLGASVRPRAASHHTRDALADGVVNVLAGFIQLCGGHPAFPKGDEPPEPGCAQVDLYAIIKGAHYAFHVVLGQDAGLQTWRFSLGSGHEDCVVIGVVQREPLVCDFLELRRELIERHGLRRKGAVEIAVERHGDAYHTAGEAWPRIADFAQRL